VSLVDASSEKVEAAGIAPASREALPTASKRTPRVILPFSTAREP
jgi:hypothetical protein